MTLPDLTKGCIKIWIMFHQHRTPSEKELTDLDEKWNKMPEMPLREFMQSEGYEKH